MTAPRQLKGASEALEPEPRVSGKAFFALFGAMADGCIISTHDGHIRDVNAAALKLLGGTLNEWENHHITKIIPVDVYENGKRQVHNQKDNIPFEYCQIVTEVNVRGGRLRDAVIMFAPIEDGNVSRSDIIWIMRVQDVREVSGVDSINKEKSFNLKPDSVPAAMALVGRDLRIEAVNDGFSNLKIVDALSDLPYLTDILADTEELRSMCSQTFSGEHYRFESVIVNTCGAKRTFEIFLAPGPEQAVDVETIFVFVADISEDVENRHNSFRNRSALGEVQRMSLVGGIAAGLSHELAQPLAAIGGYAAGGLRRLQSGHVDQDDLTVLMQKISNQIDRAGKTLRLMCDFSQKHTDQLAFFDINMLINETCDILKRELRIKNVKISLNLSEKLEKVWGDRVQIQQVLVNLIQNSVEEIGGQTDVEGEITITSEAKETGAVFVVIADNGPGFDEQLVVNAFTPFFTRKKGSAGMGLTICETIIESHDGEIWINPNTSNDSHVGFSLPVTEKYGE